MRVRGGERFEISTPLSACWRRRWCRRLQVLIFRRHRGVSSVGRAPALQAGGHRFEPGTLHVVSSFVPKAVLSLGGFPVSGGENAITANRRRDLRCRGFGHRGGRVCGNRGRGCLLADSAARHAALTELTLEDWWSRKCEGVGLNRVQGFHSIRNVGVGNAHSVSWKVLEDNIKTLFSPRSAPRETAHHRQWECPRGNQVGGGRGERLSDHISGRLVARYVCLHHTNFS